ncbi:flagellar basal body rod protein FlgB [Caldisalinibacter kiritimatiensis]|uniref:Flagellar basal body rod protein FlgB n=1 Tax=Caldisalinibacter kiritimatiensis TaxID=1304284 RepID=R1AQB0_9FIRM|nr:flagellar basal body rod protein FlgB [Caldisalinibacter kiritimatiensis]EOC99312.1 Flagellar basal-body rod protein FlgB [Caldisalinibacter kiritimatiensis]
MLNTSYRSIDIMKKALDGTWQRHEAITNNIANVNTPGYKRIEVNFEAELKNALQKDGLSLNTTNEKHISKNDTLNSFNPTVKRDYSYSTRKDGNNVNIDVESAELAKNTIMYNSLIRQVSNEFRKIKMVLNEGGK